MSSADSTGPAPAIQLELIDVRFAGGTTALREVSLRVDIGERVALIGPSGAGKSTLLRLVPALVPPSSGTVRVLGVDPSTLSSRRLRRLRRNIGVVSQGLDLPGSLKVIHNVDVGRAGDVSTPRALARLMWPAGRAEIDATLASLGLGGMSMRRTDELSGGQQQRVALARVLYQDPRIMIADEPVASLDPETAADVVALMSTAAATSGSTLLMSIHSPELAVRFADRIVGLRDGSIAFDLPSDLVDRDHLDEVYLGAGDVG